MPIPPRGCLGFLFPTRTEPSSTPATPSRVTINKYFITNAEADFFRVLRSVVSTRAHILAQVSLRQLLYLPGQNRSTPGRAAWQNKIGAKSIDFLLCDPATLRPLLAIELDEPTHATPKRQSRDEDLESLLSAAGLPYLRVLTSRTCDTRELAAAILPHLPSTSSANA